MMEPNLEEQYERIEEVIGEYRAFGHWGLWRALRPDKLIRLLIFFGKLPARSKIMTRENIKRVFEIIYSEDERNSPFYEIIIGPHSLHKLSCFVEQRYPDISYENLLKMHEISRIKIKVETPAKAIGFILAVGSLFLRAVPQVVVESFNIEYTSYQITTFWILVATLFYISDIVAIWYLVLYRRKQINKQTKDVIEYTVSRIKAR